MSTDDVIEYYSKLLILQYLGKDRAVGTVKAFVEPFVMDLLPNQVNDAFNIDTAVGVQLDVVGQYAGVTRYGSDFSGPVTLSDADFRQLIKMAIVQNTTGSSLADIQSLFAVFFPGAFQVYDYRNMHMSYFLDASIGSNTLAQLFVKQQRLPKPMGVQLGALIYANNINNFFGFRTYDTDPYNSSGFGSYSNYVTGNPWLSYADAVVI